METPFTKTTGEANYKTKVRWSVSRFEITSMLQQSLPET